MGEQAKTAALWGLVTVVMLVTCWIVFVTTPPIFPSYVSVPAAEAQTDLEEYLERFGKVDLNHATIQEIGALPQIDDDLAMRIMMERDRRPQGFTATEELLTVDGVTKELLDLWKNLLYCG
ncbi:MAG: helix-hairpin-helix domain-containing protein [Clostridia bacterium]|nr:helix-hairpin-helix domain-containing protein [Clostridia bacterium]